MPRPRRPLAVLALALVPALPVHATPTPVGRDTSPSICPALAVMAASAAESRRRGVPLEASLLIADQRARDVGVSAARRQRLAHAVRVGYQTEGAEEAERRVLLMCREGSL